ncbi:ROK family protein [Emcibacter nanhaiensis]|uniref:ROK family protein n=1 Tax=Emcibacter nanhaiensis TaxID=1505037 RepID=A0A501PT88_9PROT|nr:ROK family protein [Emcibacter nanhaiensis]TPD63174.1 ROK family protein [Emcibacter nanhaiensis]
MRIGIDLGGTKTEVIALEDDGDILHRERVATPKDDYKATLKTIRHLVGSTEHILGLRGTVGVGIPGAISPRTGLVKNANSTWLNGQPLPQDLEKLLERDVRVENDANCLAVSEAVDGAAAGAETVFAVIIGTGVGAGLYMNGQPLVGRNAIAGEWGHNPLPWPDLAQGEWPGPACYCGRTGCIETFLSGPGLQSQHPDQLPPEEIVNRALAGETHCRDLVERYELRLARALAHVINILDPEVIVLAGGLSQIDSLYEHIPHLWQEYVFSDHCDTPLRRAKHGTSSGVRGAAWLWPLGQDS